MMHPPARDLERRRRTALALAEDRLDAVVVGLPSNVLLLSGYWPVIGTSLAIATRDGVLVLVVPEDESELASAGFADEVVRFEPSSLEDLTGPRERIAPPLARVLESMHLTRGRIGVEDGPAMQAASYFGMYLWGAELRRVIAEVAPLAELHVARATLERLAMLKTPREIDYLRAACRTVGRAYEEGSAAIVAGVRELDVAEAILPWLLSPEQSFGPASRAGGAVACMAGPNAARAHGSHARSSRRRLEQGDLALVHVNSWLDGYCTDVTRTHPVGGLDDRQRAMFEAIRAAHLEAFAAIKPGVRAAEIDEIVRSVLADSGFAGTMKHPTGHGVGFGGIDHQARPRLHPKSPDILEPGMVFNIEPAIYIEGWNGLRHCDVVALAESGPELLTDFASEPD